jgi:Histidine kinase-, DNA gyrase B-, and HSP90-like ATPase
LRFAAYPLPLGLAL